MLQFDQEVMHLPHLILYALAWLVGVYLFNCLLAKRFIKIEPQEALLYTATMAMLGVFGEISVGSVYSQLFHTPLWQWTVYPVHYGYTSLYAPFLWGIYGFQLYLFHKNLTKWKIMNGRWLAAIFGLETIALEILLNLTFLAAFGTYLFYYSPNDLWHFTSVQAFPFFFAASFIYASSIKHFKRDYRFFIAMCFALCFVLVFLA